LYLLLIKLYVKIERNHFLMGHFKMNIGQLNVEELDKPYYCVVQIRTQPPGVLHAVILRPDKVKEIGGGVSKAIILLGESPGDQAAGWQYQENVYVVAILGKAVEKDGKWECVTND
jgi:hypothetical protein